MLPKTARSVADVMAHDAGTGHLVRLILSGSKDMICNNLFCEKVTQPCVCRLDRVISMKKLSHVQILDLSNNNLSALPPSLAHLIPA